MKLNATLMSGLILLGGMAEDASAACGGTGWFRYVAAAAGSNSISRAVAGRLVCGTGLSGAATGLKYHELNGGTAGTSLGGSITELHSNTPADPKETNIGTWGVSGSGPSTSVITYDYGGPGNGTYALYGNTAAAASSTDLSFCTGAGGTEVVSAKVFNGPSVPSDGNGLPGGCP